MSGLLFALLFAANWWHGRSLEALMTAPAVMPKPHELAEHLSAILINSQLAGICLAITGVSQGIVAFLLPGKTRDA